VIVRGLKFIAFLKNGSNVSLSPVFQSSGTIPMDREAWALENLLQEEIQTLLLLRDITLLSDDQSWSDLDCKECTRIKDLNNRRTRAW
jgi:hypothetical protein